MKKYLTVTQYAALHNRSAATIRQRIARGTLTSAIKIGSVWLLRADEPLLDCRVKRSAAGVEAAVRQPPERD